MQILYIDVYFLINFTVDFLALFFSVRFLRAKSSALRIAVGAVVGSAFATLTVLFELKAAAFFSALILSAVVMTFIGTPGSSALRRFKFIGLFLVLETFIGGLVNLCYSFLDEKLYPYISEEQLGVQNRELLLLSMIVLLSVGVLKLIVALFSGSSGEKNVDISFLLGEKSITLVGLVDSGNLVRDPLDMRPVIIAKSKIVSKHLGFWPSYDALCTCSNEFKTKIRFIPIKSIGPERLLTGTRCIITLSAGEKKTTVEAVVAFDEEDGNYAGYDALVPAELAEF